MRARRQLIADCRGVSAIEFAIIAPVLILLLLAGIQLVAYVNAVRRVGMIANSVSEMLSQAKPPLGSNTAKVNTLDLHFAFDSTLVLFPYIMTDAARKHVYWWQDITIDFAGINFTSTGLNCGTNPDQSACWVASVAWTSTGTTGNNYRPCIFPQLPVDDTAATNRYTLPRSLYGKTSAIAVDVSFTFVPTFGASFLPSIVISRSVFVQPRYADYVTFDTTNSDGIATKCLGSP